MINFNRLLAILVNRHYEYRFLSKRVIINAEGKDVPKERNNQNKITLINPDNSVTITDIKSAQNLSERRALKLVKVNDMDMKTKRTVYKLMSPAEYHQEDLQNRKAKQEARKTTFIKGEKLVTLASRIGQHDLMTHVKKIVKHLEKKYEVRVVISTQENELESAEKIASTIESNIKTLGKFVQKRFKENNLKFQILPLKEKNCEASNNEESSPGNQKDNKGPL